ncbi:MAG: serine/threonine-protein kinase [Planctomycetota bacterium]
MNTTQSEREIFLAALELEAPDARAEYLDSACSDDDELRARVEALLSAAPKAEEFLTPQQGLNLTIVTDDFDEELLPDEGFDFLKPSEKEGCLGLLDHYEVIGLLGRGAFGIVFRAYDTRLNRVAAIKVLAPAFANNPMAVRRFLREAQAAAAVSHDHVVTLHSVEQDHQPPYIVMEMIDGESLKERVDEQGPLEVVQILRIGMQMSGGLAAAHAQGLVHRDIKPANILLEEGIGRAKLTDFGLARAVDDVGMTRTGTIAGTPQYMSPEQGMGQTLDERSDLFSLGTVLYELCTGRSPFRADSTVATLKRICDEEPRPISSVNSDIPKWLEKLVMQLLEKRPEDRIQTAAETEEAFRKCLAHLQSSSGRDGPAIPGVTDRPSPRTRRRVASAKQIANAGFQAGIIVQPIVVLDAIVFAATRMESVAVVILTIALLMAPLLAIAGFIAQRRWSDIALPLVSTLLAYAAIIVTSNTIDAPMDFRWLFPSCTAFYGIVCIPWTYYSFRRGLAESDQTTQRTAFEDNLFVALLIAQIVGLPSTVSYMSFQSDLLFKNSFFGMSLVFLAVSIIQRRSRASIAIGAAPPLLLLVSVIVLTQFTISVLDLRLFLHWALAIFFCFIVPAGLMTWHKEVPFSRQKTLQLNLRAMLVTTAVLAICIMIALPNLKLGFSAFLAATTMLAAILGCSIMFLQWRKHQSPRPRLALHTPVAAACLVAFSGIGYSFSLIEPAKTQSQLYVDFNEREVSGRSLEVEVCYLNGESKPRKILVVHDGRWVNSVSANTLTRVYMGSLPSGRVLLDINDKDFRVSPSRIDLESGEKQAVRIEKMTL